MKGIWYDLTLSVQENHGGATIKVDGDRFEVVLGGVTIVAVKDKTGFSVDVTGQPQARFDSTKAAGYHVYDELNKIWAANQRPRTSRGGSSYSGGGDGDHVSAIGDTYDGPSGDDGDDE